MAAERTMEKEIGSFISTRLRNYFGKGPASVYVAVNSPFIAIQLRGFLAPAEKILLRQNEFRRVLEIRELLMKDLKPEIAMEVRKLCGFSTNEMYIDWNLEEQTGLILIVLDSGSGKGECKWPLEIDEHAFRDTLQQISDKTYKQPEETEIFWLNHRTVLLRHSGIFMKIEKELIKAGFSEELKLVKRPLERTLLRQLVWKAAVSRDVQEVFIDWHLEEDKGYIVLLLENHEKR
ncbi:Na-translocating system protein MpsC family protein [Planococcus sp. APC 3906]|uniref:Na-translocating system protein MpsC family protein n=1 Tax=Planococcus sp. APC 3906 TaxID=3035194 RepID=UPI0025B35E9F|nr:Na-translocating system protein MpsC family protein [Planococcus sp. APC 3906]MDN3448607.1 Na-translocating system protein MpsC family protein [Planococcus sp. APC 3906]